MKQYLPFLIIGLTTGSVYGIAALGLVLTYKTSGIFNFGQGAVAAAAAICFYQLHDQEGLDWPLSAVISVLVFGVVVGLVLERLAAGLSSVATSYRIVATVGLILIVLGGYDIIYGSLPKSFSPFLPQGTPFSISGVHIGYDQLATFILGIATVIALHFFFKTSRLGVAMRAVVDRPELVDLTGDSPTRVRRVSWLIGTCFAGVSGLLLANTLQQLNVTVLALLVVSAFGAATVGFFNNLTLVYAGGVIVGVVQEVTAKITSSHSSVQGLENDIPFLFLFVGLLVIPRKKLVELGTNVVRQARVTSTMRASTKRSFALAALVVAVIIPFIVGNKLPTWNGAIAELPLFLSLGLLIRTSGQISLCQIGFAAIGATTFAHMLGDGLPWLLAVLIAGAVCIPLGAIIAIPAIRLSGLYLGLATLGFGILLDQFFYGKGLMFGVTTTLPTSRPHVLDLDSDKGYYFAMLIVSLVCVAFVVLVERARLGRLLRGMADSPAALSMLGTNSNVTKVLIFCMSSFLAAVSGALTAGIFSSINRNPFSYLQSLIAFAVIMIFGRRTIPAAVISTVALNVPPAYLTGAHTADYLEVFFGIAAILVAVSSGGRASTFVARYGARLEPNLSGPIHARTTEIRRPVRRPVAAGVR